MKRTLALPFFMLLLSGCFFQLEQRERESPYNEITVRDGYQVEGFGESVGETYDFSVYRLRSVEDESAFYLEVVARLDGDMAAVFQIEDHELGAALPSSENMVLEYDVNFDGTKDILIFLGHFGNQGAAVYKCYLSIDDDFIHCPSFSEISNPAVDKEGCQILGSWRNSAASHGMGKYIVEDNVFILTETLTVVWEQLLDSESTVGSWTEEVLENGEWVVRERFSEAELSKEDLYAKVYSEASTWAIGTDQCESLYAMHNS